MDVSEAAVPNLFSALEATDEALRPFIESEQWWMQQKFDGVRVLAVCRYGEVSFVTRGGRPLKSTQVRSDAAREELSQVSGGAFVLDGEFLSDRYYVFDMPSHDGPYFERLAYALETVSVVDLLVPGGAQHVFRVKTARTREDKAALLSKLREEGAEGVMIKSRNMAYLPGQRQRDGFKAKFVKTLDCVILARNVGWMDGKTRQGPKVNAVLGIALDDGVTPQVRSAMLRDGQWYRIIGQCSMVGKPGVEGDVVEVRYLYLGAGGRLYQPTVLQVRTDKAASECRSDQLTQYERKVLG